MTSTTPDPIIVHRDDMTPRAALRECLDLWGSGAWPDETAVYNLDEVMQLVGRLLDADEEADEEAEAAERIAAGVRTGTLSWGDVAEQTSRGWCPASPEGNEPHKVTDGRTCDECGAEIGNPLHAHHQPHYQD